MTRPEGLSPSTELAVLGLSGGSGARGGCDALQPNGIYRPRDRRKCHILCPPGHCPLPSQGSRQEGWMSGHGCVGLTGGQQCGLPPAVEELVSRSPSPSRLL